MSSLHNALIETCTVIQAINCLYSSTTFYSHCIDFAPNWDLAENETLGIVSLTGLLQVSTDTTMCQSSRVMTSMLAQFLCVNQEK